MYKLAIFLLSIVNIACAKVNQVSSVPANDTSILENVKQFEIDKLGNIYIIDHNEVLSIFDKNKVKRNEYFDQRLGKIDYIDASNPMQILLHFKNQGVLKIVDNTLSELQRINLYNEGKFNYITKVCRANDNNFWIYDEQLQRIYKIDGKLNILNETNLFRDLGIKEFDPIYFRERNNNLVIVDQKGRALIFDNFGHFIKTFELGNLNAIHFDGTHFFILKEDGLYKQSVQSPDYLKINLDEKLYQSTSMKVENNLLYFNQMKKLVIKEME
jgi:hypothetical protein